MFLHVVDVSCIHKFNRKQMPLMMFAAHVISLSLSLSLMQVVVGIHESDVPITETYPIMGRRIND
jgi:hypothetical protein